MPEKPVEEQSCDVGACEEHGGQQVHRRVAEAEIAGEQELQKSCLEPDRCDTRHWAEEHRYNCNSKLDVMLILSSERKRNTKNECGNQC